MLAARLGAAPERRPLTPAELEHARQVCTPAQLRALQGWAKGWPWVTIAYDCGRSESAVRDRFDSALRNLGGLAPPAATLTARCARCGWSAVVAAGDAAAAFAAHACDAVRVG
jgi:hypothetical protein